MSPARQPRPLPRAPVLLGPYLLDWGRLRLDSPGASVKLTPKAGAVLALLLRESGRTVSRNELFDHAWPGSHSSDDVLTQVMQELRRAFDDRQRTPGWIVTVPKLGYRWEGPPAVAPDALGPAPTISPAPRVPMRSRRVMLAGLAVIAALIAAFYALPRDAGIALDTLPLATPLLREPAQEFDPHLSADGKLLVYVRAQDTHFALRLRHLADGEETTLLETGDAVLGAARLSRALDAVAYLRRTATSCELHTITLVGNADRMIASDCPKSLPSSADWSADGTALYYTRAASGDTVAQRHPAIHRIELRSGVTQRISDAGRWFSVDLHPRISADGREVAFVRDGDGRNRVVLAPADGGDEREVPYALWPYRVEWDGDDFVLAMHGRTGLELWRGDRTGALQRPLAREGAGPGLSLSLAGRLVFERHRADDNLWRLDLLDPTAPPRQLTEETGSESSPRLSPDARSLAYLSDADGSFEVHVRDMVDGRRRQWSHLAPRVPLDLRWDPRGHRALLVVGTEEGKRLAMLQEDGSLATLPAALEALVPAQIEWDGTSGDLWIAAERDGRRELLRARAPTFARVELAVDGAVVSFGLREGQPVLLRPSGTGFETVDGTPATPTQAMAIPSDQWAWRADRIVQAVQRGGDNDARIMVSDAITGAELRRVELPLPQPPLGRHFELTDDTLFYSRRDRVESDLHELSDIGAMR